MNIRFQILRIFSSWRHRSPEKRPQLNDFLAKKTQSLSPKDRVFSYELINGTVRWLRFLDYIVSIFLKKPKYLDKVIEDILQLSAYELLFMRTPIYACIHEWVEVAKATGSHGSGLVNAILRRISENAEKLKPKTIDISNKTPEERLSIVTSHPLWLISRWVTRYGYEFTVNLCEVNNSLAPFTIRVNTLKITPEDLQKRLIDLGFSVRRCELVEEGLMVDGVGYSPHSIPFFEEGYFVVQDEASQLVSRILAPKEGEVILDLCAGMGGKTTHIAQILKNNGLIYAYDKDGKKLEKLIKTSHNLGVMNIRIIKNFDELLASNLRFDAILVDAPCSGFGTIRRHPDIKWNKTFKTIRSLQRLQIMLLRTAKNLLKPNGRIVYAVCTNEIEETSEVTEIFVRENRDMIALEECGMNLHPKINGHDGFYIAKFVRRTIS